MDPGRRRSRPARESQRDLRVTCNCVRVMPMGVRDGPWSRLGRERARMDLPSCCVIPLVERMWSDFELKMSESSVSRPRV